MAVWMACRAGDQVMLSSRTPSQETSSPSPTTSSGAKEREENTDVQGGRISIFLHKREDQMSHDVIQPLLRSVVGWVFTQFKV